MFDDIIGTDKKISTPQNQEHVVVQPSNISISLKRDYFAKDPALADLKRLIETMFKCWYDEGTLVKQPSVNVCGVLDTVRVDFVFA